MADLYNEKLDSANPDKRGNLSDLRETSFVNNKSNPYLNIERVKSNSTNPNLTQQINYGMPRKGKVGKRFLVATVLILLGSLGTFAYINREQINEYFNSIVAAATYDDDYFEQHAVEGIQSEEDKPLGKQ